MGAALGLAALVGCSDSTETSIPTTFEGTLSNKVAHVWKSDECNVNVTVYTGKQNRVLGFIPRIGVDISSPTYTNYTFDLIVDNQVLPFSIDESTNMPLKLLSKTIPEGSRVRVCNPRLRSYDGSSRYIADSDKITLQSGAQK